MKEMDAVHYNAKFRHDFVLLFDVLDGNPNGDPDAGNLPRIDPETMQGLVTDVALKRKVRNWIAVTEDGKPGMEIYVQHHGVLNEQHQRAYDAIGKESKGAKQDRETISEARTWMCKSFYDIRVFGAVMTTGVNAGQVRGPAQLTFARSIDPIVPLDVSITRVAVTRAEDAYAGEEGEAGKVTEMGRKPLVPYGLYRAHGFWVPSFARDTGATDGDLQLLWKALEAMWDLDRSASRGMMANRGLIIFTHDSQLGNAPAHTLFEHVGVKRRDGVKVARSFADYTVTVLSDKVPEKIKVLHQTP
jgi:CRISPR-associated protein Csd2